MCNRKTQKINFSNGRPKGMKIILEECGVNTRNMNADKVLGGHLDFKNEISRVERYLTVECGHLMYMLPKYKDGRYQNI